MTDRIDKPKRTVMGYAKEQIMKAEEAWFEAVKVDIPGRIE